MKTTKVMFLAILVYLLTSCSPQQDPTIISSQVTVTSVDDCKFQGKLYLSEYGSNGPDIFTLNTDGRWERRSNQWRVIDNPMVAGGYVIYTRKEAGRLEGDDGFSGQEIHDIYLFNLGYDSEIRLTVGGDYHYPSISRNRMITATHGEAGFAQVVVINTSGIQKVLTESPLVHTEPTWSPDESQITYVRQTSNTGWELWVMKADGQDKKLLYKSEEVIRSVSWDNPGYILFTSPTVDAGEDIFVYNLETKNVSRLGGRFDEASPFMLANQIQIVFNAADEAYGLMRNIYSINIDGSSRCRLTNLLGENLLFGWTVGSRIG